MSVYQPTPIIVTTNDLAALMKRIGGAWAWLFGFGVIGILAGLSVLFFTGSTLLVIALAFGMWLVFSGIFRFFGTFAVPHESGWLRGLWALLAVFSVVVGVYLLGHPVLSLILLAFMIGIFWIFHGLLDLFVGIELRHLPGRTWTIVSGALGVLTGAIIIAVPAISIVALTFVLGFWLVVYGVVLCVSAFEVRSGVRQAMRLVAQRV